MRGCGNYVQPALNHATVTELEVLPHWAGATSNGLIRPIMLDLAKLRPVLHTHYVKYALAIWPIDKPPTILRVRAT